MTQPQLAHGQRKPGRLIHPHPHPIDEYARHCGHADLLRESIDGRVGQ